MLLIVMHNRSSMYAQVNSRVNISSDIFAWKISREHAISLVVKGINTLCTEKYGA